MGKRNDHSEDLERVSVVISMKIKGASSRDIRKFAAGPPWNVSDRTATTYLQKADRWFERRAAIKRSQTFGLALERLEDLYKSLVKVQDYKGALQVQREIHALLGLNAPVKIAPTDPTGEKEYNALTDEERVEQISKILDAARKRAAGQADGSTGS